jgi:hypothetical protein
MAFIVGIAVGASIAVAAGGTSMGIAGSRAKKARLAKEKEMAELEEYKRQFAELDTSNPYLNMENVYGSMTVNQQQAEFTRQQQQQNQANILAQTRGVAGASGIAALAQALSQQGSLDAQKAAVSIGEQERQNQILQLQEASRIQGLEREGDILSREAEASKMKTLMGMEAADVEAEAAKEAAARQSQMDVLGTLASGGLSLAAAGVKAGS